MFSNVAAATLALALKIAIGICLALIATVGLQQCRMDSLRDKLALEKANTQQATDANDTLTAANKALSAANDEWATRHNADLLAAEAAAIRERARAQRIAADLEAALGELDAIYESENCATWAAARVCPAISDRLWPNARSDESGTGGSARTDDGGAPR